MNSNLFSFKPASEVKKTIFDTNREIAEIEDLLEICRICDKDKRECRSCFIWQELHRRDNSEDVNHNIHNNVVIEVEGVNQNLEDTSSVSPEEPSKKFFSEMSTELLGRCQPVAHSYINFAHDNVNPDNPIHSSSPKDNGDGKTSPALIKVSEKPRLTSSGSRQLPEGKHAKVTKQDTLTLYLIAEDLDEKDCQILYHLDKGSYQSEIAKMLGLTRQAVNKRVKRLEELGIIVRKTVYPAKYLVNSDFIKVIRSRLFGTKKVDRSDDVNSLGGVEHPEPNPSSRPSKPSPPSLDVHHVSIKVPYSVNLDSASGEDVNPDGLGSASVNHQPRFACATCHKFRERYPHARKCSCKRGRWTKMNNWTYFSVRYNGYEISSNPSTIVIKGIKVSGLRKEAILAEALTRAQKILNEYFEKRYYPQTGEAVTLHWDQWQLAGKMHIALNHELSRLVQQYFGGTVSIKVDEDIVQFDSSPDGNGNPQDHVEVHTSNPDTIDYLASVVTGELHRKVQALEAVVASAPALYPDLEPLIFGGVPHTQTAASTAAITMGRLEKLEKAINEKLSQLQQERKELMQLKSELSAIKRDMRGMMQLLQKIAEAIHNIANRLVKNLAEKHIQEMTSVLNFLALVNDKITRLEIRLRDVPDPGSDQP